MLPVPGTFARVELTTDVVFLEDEERREGPLSEPLAILTPEIPFVSLDTGPEGRFIERTGHVIVRPLGSLGSLIGVNAFIPASQCTAGCDEGISVIATHRVDDYIFTAPDPSVSQVETSVNLVITGRLSALAINPDTRAEVLVQLLYHSPRGTFTAGDFLTVRALKHTSANPSSFVRAERFGDPSDIVGPFGVFATPGDTFNDFFDLDAQPFDGELDDDDFVLHITTPPFQVPVGTPTVFGVTLDVGAGVARPGTDPFSDASAGAFGRTTVDFFETLRFTTSGPVFNLPAGFTVNSAGAGIVNNAWIGGEVADGDGDGVMDPSDNCPAVANPDQTDTDADGEGDACDVDDDNDGVPDGADNCALTPNSDQANNDGDALGDACDPDDDNDGVPDGADNCTLVANADQRDGDGDGLGDACDPVFDLAAGQIDPKPGSDVNPVSCEATSLVPVAVYSTALFDATTINADTARFGPMGTEAAEVHLRAGSAQRHVEDVNKDGLRDIVFHFRVAEAGLPCHQIAPGTAVPMVVKLAATTTGGLRIAGAATVLVRQDTQ